MSSFGVCLQLMGLVLATLGWLGSVACCALPLWKLTIFSGQNLMMRGKVVEGLWHSCTLPGPGKANCKVFSSSQKEVTLDVSIARILTLATVTMAFLGILVNCLGAKCINCVRDEGVKAKLLTCSGIVFILAGLSQQLAVSWPAYILATEFYHPLVSEVLVISIGPCIYLGWAAGALLLLGGCLLGCWCCRRRRRDYGGPYPADRGADDFVAESSSGEEPAMSSFGVCLQLTGLVLATLGWLGSVACCALPLWKLTIFSGQNLMMRGKVVEGLWHSCALPGPGKANCKVFSSSQKEVTLDVSIARILTLATVTMAFLGILVNCLGAKCINCVRDEGVKAKLLTCSGIVFILAGLSQQLAVSWPAYILATEFYHPLVSEVLVISIGPCIYLGWAAGALLLLGGCLLGCWCCRRRRRRDYGGPYPAAKGADDASKNFV